LITILPYFLITARFLQDRCSSTKAGHNDAGRNCCFGSSFPGRSARADGLASEEGMGPRDYRILYWVGFVVLAILIFGYGAGWFNEAIPGAQLP
jgi:hypothetical protein